METRERDGKIEFRNGGPNWSRPVTFDDRVFARGSDLAQELGVPQSEISRAANGEQSQLFGHVRFSTMVEIREQLMSGKPANDDKGRVRVSKDKRVYAVIDGNVHRLAHYDGRVLTVEELAQELGISKTAAYTRLIRGHKGVRPATIDEAHDRWPGEETDVFARPDSVADVDDEPAVEVTPAPFIGVQWPDGRVVVRLAQGGDWKMERESVDALPPEIRADCAWLS